MLRRLAPIAVLALAGGLALSGCQAAPPSVAAQIGDFTITNERVDQIVDQIDDEVAAARKAQANPSDAPTDATPAGDATPADAVEGLAKEQIGDVRAAVVQLTVFDELARRMVADKKLTLPPPDYKGAASQIGLSENNPYVKLAVDADAYRTLLLSKTKSVKPTEADLHAAYQKVVDSGAQVPSYDEVKPQLVALPELGQGLGLKVEMLAAIDKYDVVVNPRYEPLEMPLSSVSSDQTQIVLVTMPLGTTSSPGVRDLPAAPPPTAG